jgi:pyrroloquinoline quinone biosynthesis protein B
MKIKVLGSSAGGGFPQWNCNCPNCDGVRRGTVDARPRTQSSVAVTTNGTEWLLVNASPDILSQIAANPELQPARQIRDTGIAAVLAMDAQIDHVTGLMMLREHRAPLPLYTTATVWDDLSTGFPIGPMLKHYCGIEHREIPVGDASGASRQAALSIPFLEDVRVTALPLTSKAPPYSPHRDAPQPGDNIGLVLERISTGKQVFYAPGLGAVEPHVYHAMAHADVILVDGTLWTHDEMIRLGLSQKTSLDMGHLPQSGPGGMVEVLDSIDRPGARKVLIHINNSNPILVEDGPERAELLRHGIEVAYDGMQFEL